MPSARWIVLRMTDLGLSKFGGTPKFEQVTRKYVEASGPSEAILRAIGDCASSSEYRAYLVEGSAVLRMELTVNVVEDSGVPQLGDDL